MDCGLSPRHHCSGEEDLLWLCTVPLHACILVLWEQPSVLYQTQLREVRKTRYMWDIKKHLTLLALKMWHLIPRWMLWPCWWVDEPLAATTERRRLKQVVTVSAALFPSSCCCASRGSLGFSTSLKVNGCSGHARISPFLYPNTISACNETWEINPHKERFSRRRGSNSHSLQPVGQGASPLTELWEACSLSKSACTTLTLL